MKEKSRLFILKILSSIAVYCVVYVLFLTLRVFVFHTSGGFVSFLFALFITAAGFSLSMTEVCGSKLIGRISGGKVAGYLMLYKSDAERKHILLSVFLYLSSILPALATLAIYNRSGIIRAGFEALSILIIYLVAVRCGLNNAYNNLRKGISALALLIFPIAYGVTLYTAQFNYLIKYVCIFAYFFLLVYLIVKNQEDIDINIYLGKFVEKSVLPKDMRKFNIKSVLLLYTLILAVINSRTLLKVMLQIWAWFKSALIFILSLFHSEEIAAEPEKALNNPQSQGFPFSIEPAPQTHPLLAYLGDVIFAFVLLYLAYLFLTLIYRSIFKKLFPMIALFLKSFFLHSEDEKPVISGDYDDEVAIEKPVSERSRRRKAGVAFKKARNYLKNITDPIERIRFMYGAALELLQAAGVEISGSDTVRNIYAKAAAITGLADIRQPLDNLSGKYEKVRYGCMAPSNDELPAAEESYRDITGLLLKKR